MSLSLQFAEAAFLSVLSIRDLTPNTGFFWYFFIEARPCQDVGGPLPSAAFALTRSFSAITCCSSLRSTPIFSSTQRAPLAQRTLLVSSLVCRSRFSTDLMRSHSTSV